MVQQKMVVKLSMGDPKMRSKALKTAVSLCGVQSVTIDGEKLVVVGELDSITLTTELRKKMRHHVELVSVGEDKKEEKKEIQDIITVLGSAAWPPCHLAYVPQYAYARDPYYDSSSCTIL